MQEFIEIKTYDALQAIVKGWAEGHLKLLILMGSPGTGKSRVIKDIVGEEPYWFNGHATAFGVYMAGYQYIDRPLIFDDTDGLLRDRAGIRLLKCLCQTDTSKDISWVSNAGRLYELSIPQTYTTRSPVCIICNDFSVKSIHQAAVADRGACVRFVPSKLELATYVASWFEDQEVFDYVTSILPRAHRPSIRLYMLALDLKAAGLNWKELILSKLQGDIF